eukprot:m.354173 g.354173  ORF g.354173 m.354173 type:complete len:102 (+) comp16943_c0_seq1:48-353(+)
MPSGTRHGARGMIYSNWKQPELMIACADRQRQRRSTFNVNLELGRKPTTGTIVFEGSEHHNHAYMMQHQLAVMNCVHELCDDAMIWTAHSTAHSTTAFPTP